MEDVNLLLKFSHKYHENLISMKYNDFTADVIDTPILEGHNTSSQLLLLFQFV